MTSGVTSSSGFPPVVEGEGLAASSGAGTCHVVYAGTSTGPASASQNPWTVRCIGRPPYRRATIGGVSAPTAVILDLDGVIAGLPDGFDGWAVLEVDVPNLPTRVESARAGLSYFEANPAFAAAVP